MEYTNYSVEDFVMDPDFRKWVKENDSTSSSFWESWKAGHPEKAEEIDEARQIVLLLDLKGQMPTQEQYERVWAKITAQRRRDKVAGFGDIYASGIENKKNKIFVGIAASLALMILAIGAYFLIDKNTEKVYYTTGYGETRTFQLPDNSEVTLNANSRLTYTSGWSGEEPREVWLEGEAYFEVNEIGVGENSQKFLVHTDYLDVEVLGTKFNVNQRRGKTQVVLSSGKVKLAAKKDGTVENVLMKPGELAEFGKKQQEVTKKVVNPVAYTSWRNNLLVIDNKTMHEIVRLLEDNYGLKVEVKDSTGFDEVLQGKLPAGNIDIILQSLSKTYGLEIQKAGKSVMIRKSKIE